MSQQEHAALTSARVALRDQRGLRVVTAKEEGFDVASLPKGVYGFTGAPAAAELPVYANPTFRCTEVQKDATGAISLIGYVNSDEAVSIEKGGEPVSVDLYPDPYEQARSLVAVPLARLDRRKPPTRDRGNSMRADIAPKS